MSVSLTTKSYDDRSIDRIYTTFYYYRKFGM